MYLSVGSYIISPWDKYRTTLKPHYSHLLIFPTWWGLGKKVRQIEQSAKFYFVRNVNFIASGRLKEVHNAALPHTTLGTDLVCSYFSQGNILTVNARQKHHCGGDLRHRRLEAIIVVINRAAL